MIKIMVRLESDFNVVIHNDIEITKEELQQLACNKARNMYTDGAYPHITAKDELRITGELN